MARLSTCGLDCEICEHREKNGCTGCRENKGKIFWGECDLYTCCDTKKQEHCGKCGEFPCQTLEEWASSEGSERIGNLRTLIG